jgi:hypothetical protein
MKVVVGVDTHKKSHAVVVLRAAGDALVSFSIAATPEGFQNAVDRVLRFSEDAV